MAGILIAVMTITSMAPIASAQSTPLIGGGLTALPTQSMGPNLVQNPGFETAGPAGWPAAGGWSLDQLQKHGGSFSYRRDSGGTMQQTFQLKAGVYKASAWVKTQGLGSGSSSGLRLTLDFRPGGLNQWTPSDVVSGTNDWRLVEIGPIVVDVDRTAALMLEMYNGPGGTAWFDDVTLTQIQSNAVEVFLLYPNFRGMLFDDRAQTVRVAVTAAAGGPVGRVRLSLVDEAGGAVKVTREVAAASPTTAELDAAGLPLGRYRLRAELLDAGGGVAARYPDYRIVKLPGKARDKLHAWYDERNVFHAGGKPQFVIGLYNTSGYTTTRSSYANGIDGAWGNDRISEAPINMLINYHLGAAPVPALTTYLDDLAARGIRYLQTVNFYEPQHPEYKRLPYPAAKQGEDALNRWVAETLGKHSGLAGFYTMDERPADQVPSVFRQYQQLAAAAPGSVTYGVLGDGWESQAPLWRDAMDVMGLDPYPITKPSGQNNLAMVGEWTRLGQDAVKHSRPVWMVLQYFPVTDAAGWPSEAELRTMSWMAIIEGARGLLYWSFGEKGLAWVKDAKEKEKRWAELVRVTKEIKALEPVLLAPDAAIVARESSGGAVRTLGKATADARYLFAYNTRNSPTRVTWTLAAPAAETTDLASNAAGPRVEGTALTVELAPYEVRRLRIR